MADRVRRAVAADLPRCLDLAKSFHAQSIWADVPFDEPSVRNTVLGLLENGVIFLSADGFLGAVIAPLMFNKDVKLAYELMWFAGHSGGALINAYERWAKEQGAHPVMVCLENGRVETMCKVYKRRGYQPTERIFIKRS